MSYQFGKPILPETVTRCGPKTLTRNDTVHATNRIPCQLDCVATTYLRNEPEWTGMSREFLRTGMNRNDQFCPRTGMNRNGNTMSRRHRMLESKGQIKSPAHNCIEAARREFNMNKHGADRQIINRQPEWNGMHKCIWMVYRSVTEYTDTQTNHEPEWNGMQTELQEPNRNEPERGGNRNNTTRHKPKPEWTETGWNRNATPLLYYIILYYSILYYVIV